MKSQVLLNVILCSDGVLREGEELGAYICSDGCPGGLHKDGVVVQEEADEDTA